jgi:hypothetical protein
LPNGQFGENRDIFWTLNFKGPHTP